MHHYKRLLLIFSAVARPDFVGECLWFRPLPVIRFLVNLPVTGREAVHQRDFFNTDAPGAMLTGRLSISKRANGDSAFIAYFPASFFSALTMSVFSQG